MPGGEVGGDLAQLDSLSKTFDVKAKDVADLTSTIDSSLSQTVWKGANATKFRDSWGGFKTTLQKLQGELADASTAVRKQREALAAATGDA